MATAMNVSASTTAMPDLHTSGPTQPNLRASSMFWFEGILVPIVGSIGLAGNTLSILVLVLRDLDLKASFRNLLVTLCVFDMLFILTVELFYTMPIHSEWYAEELLPYLTPLLLPLIHIVLTGSVYSVVAVAVERCFIICNPFNTDYQGRGMRYMAFIVIFSLVYNINKFFEVTIDYEWRLEVTSDPLTNHSVEQNVTMAKVGITELRANPDYTKTVIIVNFIFMVVLPLAILSLCHVYTFRAIRKNTARHNAISSHQRRDNAMAMLFFIIIACFVLSHTGKFVLNFYEISLLFIKDDKDERSEWPLWAFLLTRANHLLLVVNSSINFFIYCFRDAKFRKELLTMLKVENLLGEFLPVAVSDEDMADHGITTTFQLPHPDQEALTAEDAANGNTLEMSAMGKSNNEAGAGNHSNSGLSSSGIADC